MYWISTSYQTKLLPSVEIIVTQISEELQEKGTNSVFAKLMTNDLKMNIRGIGCAAHILHSALRTSADILPVDIEAIVNKIFQYFHIYTIRVEELKEFCDFIDIEYKQVLGSVKTRWLSLQAATTRVIDIRDKNLLFFPKKNAR
jgi:hypothetical protein